MLFYYSTLAHYTYIKYFIFLHIENMTRLNNYQREALRILLLITMRSFKREEL